MENIILALIGLSAVGFAVRKAWLVFRGASSCGCGSSTCSGARPSKECSCHSESSVK
ncbi:hypothetical protein P22_0703 [Propionispora sp. 2/2-37]|uniref:FeoB-associated Cys-rich membrane protein n=1 Tax=Propionispora sp. 2/2-37 TaxID=1677858 RepID=UPI0006C15D1A|nr:FeoB-associated Cys-rich membrane protein [Propionispora sp. 2/2-37]CUH94637.1 hypothetical protein P22_0703 [Propionispora sp. 2/2-37]